MARYYEDVKMDQPLDVVSMAVEDFIYHGRFFRTDWQGEPVYCSTDASKNERYFKWSYTSGVFHVEAWMKGAFGNETNLNGGGSKKEFKESIEKLIQTIQTHSGNAFEGSYIGHDPIQHPVYQRSFVEQERSHPIFREALSQHSAYQSIVGQNTKALDVPAFVLGIVALIFSFLVPIFGIILGSLGLSLGRRAGSASSNGKVKAAKVCCTLAIVIGLICFMIPFFTAFGVIYSMY